MKLGPPTDHERRLARDAARALRAAIANPTKMGQEQVMFVDYGSPRRGEKLTIWEGLPGFIRHGDGHYTHACLPGWQYTKAEIVREMIPDLEALAEHGIRPTEATA